MKTIEYEGVSYEVPDEAKYVVRNDNGAVYWFESIPRYGNSGWCSTISYTAWDVLVAAPIVAALSLKRV